jgi:hypothetical protein
MSIITEAELRGFRNIDRSSSKSLNESLLEYKSINETNKTNIFLSHKHDELEYLDGAIALFRSLNINIYVDWLDEEMPKTTSGETATIIKEKIKQCDKFILLATEAAIASIWCNWELGLGDAAKYIKNIALFPVRKVNQNYTGNEYLQIYPSIEYRDGTSTYLGGKLIPKGYYVLTIANDNSRTIELLSSWLKK